MLKRVRVQITSDRFEVKGSLFETPTGQFLPTGKPPVANEDIEHMELTMEGRYYDNGSMVSISYEESELTGMEGTTSTISYHKSEPGVITMARSGTVRTALVFEEGKRHMCIYKTPIMPFEVAVETRHVHNAIETEGALFLDYTVELRGANAEFTRFSMTLLPDFSSPKNKG